MWFCAMAHRQVALSLGPAECIRYTHSQVHCIQRITLEVDIIVVHVILVVIEEIAVASDEFCETYGELHEPGTVASAPQRIHLTGNVNGALDSLDGLIVLPVVALREEQTQIRPTSSHTKYSLDPPPEYLHRRPQQQRHLVRSPLPQLRAL